ncbi:type II toxin-antitoxin system PemK/MazF family toxin [Paeniglutamicibacter sp. R2-26]|uniref:type II toxin-antitoxin system PemK/MazF family toxin n=1 Tax=Paeniglutamicibacter sp. R2-26 TaxID=3144417 RepID=UPI003EE62246
MKFNANKFFGFLGRVLDGFLKSQDDAKAKSGAKPSPTRTRNTGSGTKVAPKPKSPAGANRHQASRPSHTGTSGVSGWEDGGYPGDFHGAIKPAYNPVANGEQDPGEIVWAWVPYEEDYSQGKDRPILLVGRDGKYLLALMLTSKDHNNAGHSDRGYVDIGAGPWDKQGRPSEIKVDRVIRLKPSGIRREGAVLEKRLFSRVAARIES